MTAPLIWGVCKLLLLFHSKLAMKVWKSFYQKKYNYLADLHITLQWENKRIFCSVQTFQQ